MTERDSDDRDFEDLLEQSTLGSPAAKHIRGLAPTRLFEVRMSPDEMLKFGLYLRALGTTMRPDAVITLEQALEDSGVIYEKHEVTEEDG